MSMSTPKTPMENETLNSSKSSSMRRDDSASNEKENNDTVSLIGTAEHVESDRCEIRNARSKRGPSPSSTFPVKLHEILSCSEFRHIITWMSNGSSWRVLQPKLFERNIMPEYFAQQSKYSSFTRQVNGWGFKRITQGKDRNCYYHPLFKENMPHLTRRMKRLSVSMSKREIGDQMKNPDVYPVVESQVRRLERPTYQEPQAGKYSHYWNGDPQYNHGGYQNNYYYYPQENPQVSHFNASHRDNYYNYENVYYQTSHHDTSHQTSYHDTTYQTSHHDTSHQTSYHDTTYQNSHNDTPYQNPYHEQQHVIEQDYPYYTNAQASTQHHGRYKESYNETNQFEYHHQF